MKTHKIASDYQLLQFMQTDTYVELTRPQRTLEEESELPSAHAMERLVVTNNGNGKFPEYILSLTVEDGSS